MSKTAKIVLATIVIFSSPAAFASPIHLGYHNRALNITMSHFMGPFRKSSSGHYEYEVGISHKPNDIICDWNESQEIPIPEPMTLALFGVGVAGITTIRKRNAKKETA